MRLIKHIKASNLLSFGPDGLDLELQDLNVLIGANGSGKSNFLEIFEILKSLPQNEESDINLKRLITKGGGGISEWLWKGEKNSKAFLELIVEVNDTFVPDPYVLEHKFNIYKLDWINEEAIVEIEKGKRTTLYLKNGGTPSMLKVGTSKIEPIEFRHSNLSILSQRIGLYSIGELANEYERIRLYREWSFGRNTIFRYPQSSEQGNDRLNSDFSNLGMFLSRLRKDPNIKRALIAGLQDLYDGLTDFEVSTEPGGTVQILFTEGNFSIPATRLSDGSLRYLCLLAILLDPTPPPLICIEEPELGLHPDIMPKIADLLVDASKRTQLVVTTHSEILIDALSEQPESILVCEKHEGQTQIKRLSKDDIAHWLKDYSLGELWIRGELGGKRW